MNQEHDGLRGYDQEVNLEVIGRVAASGHHDGFEVLWVFKMQNGQIVLSAERPRYLGLDTSYKVVSAGATPRQVKRRARAAGTSVPLVAPADIVAWVHLASHA
ncbi:MAG: hypothetical protein KGI60_04715 [Patescibacteria group bacterium]|nr:hypothetical protein [Patescibacteria group bacterium]